MLVGTECDTDLARNLKGNGESYVWREISEHKDDQRSNVNVGLEEKIDYLAKANSVCWYE